MLMHHCVQATNDGKKCKLECRILFCRVAGYFMYEQQ